MLLLQKVFLFSLLALLVPQTTTQNSKQELNDQLFDAVRKGDAAGVTAALDKGADVNAKFRYGQTALFKAAERGNADVAKILLDRGADVNVKDTFYQATAMTWALDGKHVGVVRLILDKSAEDVDDVLLTGTRENNQELIKVALDKGGVKAENLTAALVLATEDKNTAVADVLTKAGAKPPIEVDAATLQTYAGKYKGDPGPDATISVQEGKLMVMVVGVTRQPQRLIALDNTTFRPLAFGGITLTFNSEGGKVTGMALKQGNSTTQMKRID
ncbi:MAG TPA: ankyrin repeat domain-containing protein [Pyrinomonadaceae bacterium]|nr:ankyrin repeat domain-containing protein [Pyrinomonadaceae bacterium]